ncbi:hypothetical protein [Exiguobacterium sp. s183]|uniref:hypothetical protein n=1 Tax=Exiguobacterium sp. s183 TaxID=2751262 RepID=UPI001BE77C73|nr:hypothetical protein [Exiguobacterium sp. s183]
MRKRRRRAIVQQHILRRTAERKRMKQAQAERQRKFAEEAIERGDCPNCFLPTHGGFCDCMIVDGEFKGAWWQK